MMFTKIKKHKRERANEKKQQQINSFLPHGLL